MGHTMNLIRTLGVALQLPDPAYPVDYGQTPSVWQQISSALTVSMHRVLVMLARFFPGLVAFFIAVGLFTALGMLASLILRKVLTSARFDERVATGASSTVVPNVQDWSPKHSPTMLVARVAFWVCVLLGFVVGISAFDAAYSGSSQISVFLLPYLTHTVGAILIFLAGNLIARFLARSVLIGGVNAQLKYARFLSLGVKWLVLVLTAAMVLDHLQIAGTIVALAFGILFGGIVLTIALAVGLGSRAAVGQALERRMDHTPVTDPEAAETPAAKLTPAHAGEPLRHF